MNAGERVTTTTMTLAPALPTPNKRGEREEERCVIFAHGGEALQYLHEFGLPLLIKLANTTLLYTVIYQQPSTVYTRDCTTYTSSSRLLHLLSLSLFFSVYVCAAAAALCTVFYRYVPLLSLGQQQHTQDDPADCVCTLYITLFCVLCMCVFTYMFYTFSLCLRAQRRRHSARRRRRALLLRK